MKKVFGDLGRIGLCLPWTRVFGCELTAVDGSTSATAITANNPVDGSGIWETSAPAAGRKMSTAGTGRLSVAGAPPSRSGALLEIRNIIARVGNIRLIKIVNAGPAKKEITSITFCSDGERAMLPGRDTGLVWCMGKRKEKGGKENLRYCPPPGGGGAGAMRRWKLQGSPRAIGRGSTERRIWRLQWTVPRVSEAASANTPCITPASLQERLCRNAIDKTRIGDVGIWGSEVWVLKGEMISTLFSSICRRQTFRSKYNCSFTVKFRKGPAAAFGTGTARPQLWQNNSVASNVKFFKTVSLSFISVRLVPSYPQATR